MKRTLTSFLFSLFLLVAFGANAQEKTALGQCIADCQSTLALVCYDGEDKRDIKHLCAAVPTCANLEQGDVNAAAALFTACYEGIASTCPENCGKKAESPKAPATPKSAPPKTVRQTPPPKRDQCTAAGGFYITEPGGTEKFCYTHQAMYEHLRALEKRLDEMGSRVKDGEPVPAGVKTEYERQYQLLKDIDQSVVALSSDLKNLSDRITRDYNRFGLRLQQIEARLDTAEADIQMLKQHREEGGQLKLDPALTGWSVNPYLTFQAFKLYDESMYAGGLELGIYPSVSRTGRNRLAFVAGGGKANDYFGENMLEAHIMAGYRYTGSAGAFTIGAATHLYSQADIQQRRLWWVGPQIEGRVFLAGFGTNDEAKTEPRLYLLGRLGAGYRYGRHGVLDTSVEPTEGRFDMPLLFGFGVEDVPFL